MRKSVLAVVVLALIVDVTQAADVYVVQGSMEGRSVDPTTPMYWNTDAFLHNGGTADAVIVLKRVSNGGQHPSEPLSLTLPAGRSTSLLRARPGWRAMAGNGLWVVQLDVPNGIAIDDLLYVGSRSTLVPLSRPYRFGLTRIPVVQDLAAPGVSQVHQGTHLGPEIPSHINVAVFNGGQVPARVVVEVRQHCDDALLQRHETLVTANTMVQLPFIRANSSCSDVQEPIGSEPFALYTVITVDQPSLSVVSTVFADEPSAAATVHVSMKP